MSCPPFSHLLVVSAFTFLVRTTSLKYSSGTAYRPRAGVCYFVRREGRRRVARLLSHPDFSRSRGRLSVHPSDPQGGARLLQGAPRRAAPGGRNLHLRCVASRVAGRQQGRCYCARAGVGLAGAAVIRAAARAPRFTHRAASLFSCNGVQVLKERPAGHEKVFASCREHPTARDRHPEFIAVVVQLDESSSSAAEDRIMPCIPFRRIRLANPVRHEELEAELD